MTTRKELVNGGLYYTEACAANGAFETGVNLTGFAGQGARYVTASNTVVTTVVATSGDSITLTPGDQGDWLTVVNYSGSPVKVYPPVGWKVHNAALNAAYTVPANKTAMFTQITDPFTIGSGTNEYCATLSA